MPHRADVPTSPTHRDQEVDEAMRLLRDPATRWRGVLRLADTLDPASAPGAWAAPSAARGAGVASEGVRPASGTSLSMGGAPDSVWAALPDDLTGPAEAVLALARVHERYGARPDGRPWPSWRSADLPVPVQVAWLRAELHTDPAATLRREPPGELLYQAARQTDIARTRSPEPLVAALVESGDPVLGTEALRCVRQGLRAGLLTPAAARRHAVVLLRSTAPGVVADVLRELSEPWAALEPLPADLLSGLLADGPPDVAEAALATAARHGHGDLLRRAVTDTALPPGARGRALELLGDLADRDDIGALLDLAAADPPLFGRAALTCLSGLHRRGHFPSPGAAPAVIALALADDSIPSGEAATVLYTCRREALSSLTDAAPDDPSWPRRLDLMVALAEQGTSDLPVGAEAARLLPHALAPGPFLDAVRALRHQEAEEAVLALLPTAPAAALRALEAVGGERTVLALAEGLGLADELDARGNLPSDPAARDEADSGTRPATDVTSGSDPRTPPTTIPDDRAGATDTTPHAADTTSGSDTRTLLTTGPDDRAGATDTTPQAADADADADADATGGSDSGEGLTPGPGASHGEAEIAVPLRPVRHQALTLLWRLTSPEQRRALLPRLDPHDLPAGVVADLGAPDPAELAVLTARLDPEDPVHSLCTVAAHGDATDPRVLADLLLRVVSGVASAREPGGGPWPLGDGGAAEEPTVPQEVVDALCALGRRLHARGRIRPLCLLDAADGPAAGRAFTASLALDLVERSDLADGEIVVLLELLTRVPFPGTRARVHRLLRHRDPHVRKHAIALVAGDPTDADGAADGADSADDATDGARALSASLVALTAARDIQTVRQAVAALGRARARWASGALAACLDHPNMNIRKTAARSLVEAGTPDAVPALLRHLGRSDNPGLRTELVRALGAVLGDTRTATVLAAAEGASGRTRERLLRGLDALLPVHTCAALAEQGSPTARDLLALIGSGDIRLADGAPEDLAAAMSAHGITLTDGVTPRRGSIDGAADADAEALSSRGWDAAIALRMAARPDPPDAERLQRLRPRLPDFLRLAESGPTARVLRLALLTCPAPRSAREQRLLARHATTLLEGLADLATASGGSRAATDEPGGRDAALVDDLVEALEESVPTLAADEALAAVERLRALPLGAIDGRRALRLLTLLGAVLLRSDLDRALTAARSGPDPWVAEAAVLREAFGLDAEDERSDATCSHGSASDAWRRALEIAVRSPAGLAELRRADTGAGGTSDEISARRRLAWLVESYPTAEPSVRALLVDWMCDLQPLGAPPWTIGETARANPRAHPRPIRDDDLDQPPSTALRERLLTLLQAPEQDRRDAAARRLADWPEPRVRRTVLDAYLHGRLTLPLGPRLADSLAHALATADPPVWRGKGVRQDRRDAAARRLADWPEPRVRRTVLDAYLHGRLTLPLGARLAGTLAHALATADPPVWRAKGVRPERVLGVAAHLAPEALVPLLPWLLESWQHGSDTLRPDTANLLRRVPADLLADRLRERVDSGDHGWLDLLRHRPLLRTAWLTRIVERLRAQGQDDLADDLVLVDGPLRPPGTAAHHDAAVLRGLRERRPPAARPDRRGSSRADLFRLARTSDPESARRALRRLVEAHPGHGPDTDPALVDLLTDLVEHARPKVRLYAYRAARALLDRDTHLRLTELLLDDPRPDVVRMALRTLCRARWEPAFPAVVGLLTHPHAVVRTAAAEELADLGPAAVPALRYAADHARPDRRGTYAEVLARIGSERD